MVRKMLIAAAVLVVLMATPAAATYDFEVSPATVQPGGTVTLSGHGCAPGSPVTVTVTQRSTGKVVLELTGTADDQGEFKIPVTIPTTLTGGWYDIQARCGLPDCTADSSRALQGEVDGC